MTSRDKKIVILVGGTSCEREVSLVTGTAVADALAELKRSGNAQKLIPTMCSVEEYFDAVDLKRYMALEETHLKPFRAKD